MRLSDSKRREIERAVMDGLYAAPEEKLKERREAIAKRNYELATAEMAELTKDIPIEYLTKSTTHPTRVSYTQPPPGEGTVKEVWRYYSEEALLAPTKPSRWGSPDSVEHSLQREVLLEARDLCEDIISFKKEKKDMSDFLLQTLHVLNTVNQVKKAWPESLHQYLPAPPPKKPRKKPGAPVEIPEIAAPEHLAVRLTTNLLED